ncbi:uncharacterized protein LOC130654330 [Hydractinia symbiolongicarpus]|uniref:uncharacterized protein LOC130654330 n=1 Tax=Hydractinia symbiolongicarpus TaxID=13093 RepID=UPI002551B28C|nr:uncharacterized protein LOC130654330 [Hydractinia symbiolongicarpus]
MTSKLYSFVILAYWFNYVWTYQKGSVIGKRCNYRYTFKQHLFNSPGYPSFYPNNATCLWKIVAKEGWHVQLTIIDLNIENSKHCGFDSVTIYDGEGETAIPIKKLCGVIPPEAVRSVSNIVTILMTSDETVNGKGFRIKYKMVPGCRKTYSSSTSSDIITSPGYPFAYPDGTYCTYHIAGNEGQNIKISILDFQLEEKQYYECFDHLSIFTVPEQEPERLIGQFCGKSIPNSTFCVKDTSVNIRFVTDDDVHYRGFRLKFEITDEACKEQKTEEIVNLSSVIYMDNIALFNALLDEELSNTRRQVTVTSTDSTKKREEEQVQLGRGMKGETGILMGKHSDVTKVTSNRKKAESVYTRKTMVSKEHKIKQNSVSQVGRNSAEGYAHQLIGKITKSSDLVNQYYISRNEKQVPINSLDVSVQGSLSLVRNVKLTTIQSEPLSHEFTHGEVTSQKIRTSRRSKTLKFAPQTDISAKTSQQTDISTKMSSQTDISTKKSQQTRMSTKMTQQTRTSAKMSPVSQEIEISTISQQTRMSTMKQQTRMSLISQTKMFTKTSTTSQETKISTILQPNKMSTMSQQTRMSSKTSTVSQETKISTILQPNKMSTMSQQTRMSSKTSTVSQETKTSTILQPNKMSTMSQQTRMSSKTSTVSQETKTSTILQPTKMSTMKQQTRMSSKTSTVSQETKTSTILQPITMSTMSQQTIMLPKTSTVSQETKISTILQQTRMSTMTQQTRIFTISQETRTSTMSQETKLSTKMSQETKMSIRTPQKTKLSTEKPQSKMSPNITTTGFLNTQIQKPAILPLPSIAASTLRTSFILSPSYHILEVETSKTSLLQSLHSTVDKSQIVTLPSVSRVLKYGNAKSTVRKTEFVVKSQINVKSINTKSAHISRLSNRPICLKGDSSYSGTKSLPPSMFSQVTSSGHSSLTYKSTITWKESKLTDTYAVSSKNQPESFYHRRMSSKVTRATKQVPSVATRNLPCRRYLSIEVAEGNVPLAPLVSKERLKLQEILKLTIQSIWEVGWPHEGALGQIGIMHYGTLLHTRHQNWLLYVRGRRRKHFHLLELTEMEIKQNNVNKLRKLNTRTAKSTIGTFLLKIPTTVRMKMKYC